MDNTFFKPLWIDLLLNKGMLTGFAFGCKGTKIPIPPRRNNTAGGGYNENCASRIEGEVPGVPFKHASPGS